VTAQPIMKSKVKKIEATRLKVLINAPATFVVTACHAYTPHSGLVRVYSTGSISASGASSAVE